MRFARLMLGLLVALASGAARAGQVASVKPAPARFISGLLLIDHSVAWNRLLARQGEAAFKKLVPDGVHPNADGWRQVVTPAMLRALGLAPAASPQ